MLPRTENFRFPSSEGVEDSSAAAEEVDAAAAGVAAEVDSEDSEGKIR